MSPTRRRRPPQKAPNTTVSTEANPLPAPRPVPPASFVSAATAVKVSVATIVLMSRQADLPGESRLEAHPTCQDDDRGPAPGRRHGLLLHTPQQGDSDKDQYRHNCGASHSNHPR